jgi:hypothetical protein
MECVKNCYSEIQRFAQKEVVRVAAPALIGTAIAVIAAAYLANTGASVEKMVGWTVIPPFAGLIGSVIQGIRISDSD